MIPEHEKQQRFDQLSQFIEALFKGDPAWSFACVMRHAEGDRESVELLTNIADPLDLAGALADCYTKVMMVADAQGRLGGAN